MTIYYQLVEIGAFFCLLLTSTNPIFTVNITGKRCRIENHPMVSTKFDSQIF